MRRGLAGLLLLLILAACRTPVTTRPESNALRLAVREDGVYRVKAEALREAGLSLDELAYSRVQLSKAGKSVPFLLDEDSLIFYGQGSRSRYTREQVYVLRIGEPGTVMPEAPAPSAGSTLQSVERTLFFEENWEYLSDARDAGVEEPWFWHSVPLQGELSLSVTTPRPADGSGRLGVHLYGASHHPQEEPDHTLALQVNGGPSYEISWDGQKPFSATLSLENGTLVDGDNALRLTNVPEGFLDLMKLDRLQLDYMVPPEADQDRLHFRGAAGKVTLRGFSGTPLLLNVADPTAPTVLVDWEESPDGGTVGLQEAYQVAAVGPEGFLQPAEIAPLRSGGWREASNQADLLIITTDELAPALDPLVKARQAQGLVVSLVPVAEIFDGFGDGMATPESIHNFLTYAVDSWAPPHPQYVLLVGDATIDYHGFLSGRPESPVNPPRNVIPPFLVPVSFGGETVSDARLADVDGDLKPDLAVGRWPVDDVDAVRELVDRTLAYESGSAAGKALFATDASGAEFGALADRLIRDAELPMETVQLLNGPLAADVSSAWNDGAWLVTYAGHGSLQLWGKDSIFSTDSISQLSSSRNVPVLLQLTCLTGLYAHPEITSLSERLLLDEDGPVLTVAATSLTLSSHQEPFARAFLAALLDPETQRIGEALQQAKESLDVSNAALLEISDTFGLLGDPSALIARP
jgi:hypothetical protein